MSSPPAYPGDPAKQSSPMNGIKMIMSKNHAGSLRHPLHTAQQLRLQPQSRIGHHPDPRDGARGGFIFAMLFVARIHCLFYSPPS
jgi:hypothetical protein